MNVIIPAILPRSRDDLADKLLRLEGIATEVQIDIVDGRFASPPTWPYIHPGDITKEHVAEVPFLGSFRVEMDLMTAGPEEQVGQWVNAGAQRITIHAESTHHLPKLIQDFRTTYGHDIGFAPGLLALGLAINIRTELSLIEPFLAECDYVQFMGISEIGKQGQPYDTSVLMKLSSFHKKYPHIPFQVDGGVSLDTAPALLSAGVSRLVVGSALWNARDLHAAYAQFVELTSRFGVYA